MHSAWEHKLEIFFSTFLNSVGARMGGNEHGEETKVKCLILFTAVGTV